VVVTAASVPDRDGGKLVLKSIDLRYPRLKADLGRRGVPGDRRLGTVDPPGRAGDRAADVQGVEVQPKRWIVERTFAWLGRYRRLGKDDERQAETSEAVIQWR
jgi:putative transposase